MADLETVEQIVDPEFRSGTSQKTGKPWTIAKIKVQSGKVVSTFDTVKVGDKVEVYQEGEYWNARKPRNKGGVDPQTLETIVKLLEDNNRMLKLMVGEEKSEPKPETETAKEVEAELDNPVDLSDIPF